MLKYVVALLVLSSAALFYVVGSPLIGDSPFLKACICIGGKPTAEALLNRWSVAILEPDETSPDDLTVISSRSSLVLAYLNFGYAEEWRDYWGVVNSSGIIHGESPEYEGEYFVEYWSPLWLNVTSSLAKEYISRGFDGVLLDNMDACKAIENKSWAPSDPCAAMASSVVELVRNIKREYPNARVFVNIGVATDMLGNESFLESIDGVLREEVWYVWTGPCTSKPTLENDRANALHYLELARESGKTVIVADFVSDPIQANRVCWEAWARAFIPVPQPACDHDYTEPPNYKPCTSLPTASPRLAISSS